MLIEQIKRSTYIVKLYKNAGVANPLANYTLLDYGFELMINNFLKGKKIATIQSWNIVTISMLKRIMK